MSTLLHVSLRQKAIFIPKDILLATKKDGLKITMVNLVANLAKLGFGVSEELLYALNQTSPTFQAQLLEVIKKVMGVNKNWTPLVKNWEIPTGESAIDHFITFFATIFGVKGTRLTCGHIIPAGTFPLERYNGCPYCGTPFEFGKIENYGQGSKLRILELWTEKEANQFFIDLLTSKTALDATQIDSLKILFSEFNMPDDIQMGMKETLMTVIDFHIENNQVAKLQKFFSSPTDILRYLWYKKTGFLQIIEPKTVIERRLKNYKHIRNSLDKSAYERLLAIKELKLHYDRKMCVMVAKWINNLSLPVENICEIMHPKRGMWVRFIRALRLAEYSKKVGFEKLKSILDVFYNQTYTVLQGRINHYRFRLDEQNAFKLLKQRPGLFARSLFANMLWFGEKSTLAAFAEVIDQVPARLVFTLNMYAENYFNTKNNPNRFVKPLGGIAKIVPKNKLLSLYNEEQLVNMQASIADLSLLAIKKRFEKVETDNKTIYIHSNLFKIPVAIGDRSETIQDLPVALMGTQFEMEGNTIRLFMQWGENLPAQHLDMDLSCHIAYDDKQEICSYSNLVATGCKHSGDIRSIPDKIGTAEYININIDELQRKKAKYVTFTCNAFSSGEITPNLVIGWMNSKFPMKVSETTGVAYDPSCVQHQVRITQNITKGLVFGVLDVGQRIITWLEIPFQGQTVGNLDIRSVEALLEKLNSKLSIGNLLTIKAEAQKLKLVQDINEADEVYDLKWAINTAAVTKLLMG